MKVPESMKAELSAWNNGDGIDLETWVANKGSFSLAVGYTSIFWPQFVEFDGYILREGFSEESLRGFERQQNGNRLAVEATMNHLHIADVQHYNCEDASKDKLLMLGNVLKEIYEAKLQWQFPDKPCTVKFFTPDDPEDLFGYEISFWQKCQE
jgi:hypothetical protein